MLEEIGKKKFEKWQVMILSILTEREHIEVLFKKESGRKKEWEKEQKLFKNIFLIITSRKKIISQWFIFFVFLT